MTLDKGNETGMIQYGIGQLPASGQAPLASGCSLAFGSPTVVELMVSYHSTMAMSMG